MRRHAPHLSPFSATSPTSVMSREVGLREAAESLAAAAQHVREEQEEDEAARAQESLAALRTEGQLRESQLLAESSQARANALQAELALSESHRSRLVEELAQTQRDATLAATVTDGLGTPLSTAVKEDLVQLRATLAAVVVERDQAKREIERLQGCLSNVVRKEEDAMQRASEADTREGQVLELQASRSPEVLETAVKDQLDTDLHPHHKPEPNHYPYRNDPQLKDRLELEAELDRLKFEHAVCLEEMDTMQARPSPNPNANPNSNPSRQESLEKSQRTIENHQKAERRLSRGDRTVLDWGMELTQEDEKLIHENLHLTEQLALAEQANPPRRLA